MKYYYLLNGKIMAANEKTPESNLDKFSKLIHPKVSVEYADWYSSLQPCEISESELEKIINSEEYLIAYKIAGMSNPIELSDIIYDNNGVITFKEPKQVGEIESVAGYVAFNINGIISGIYSNLEWLKEDYPKSGYYKLSTLRNI
jgi:hypothetical protein